jgi:hypothetical protein
MSAKPVRLTPRRRRFSMDATITAFFTWKAFIIPKIEFTHVMPPRRRNMRLEDDLRKGPSRWVRHNTRQWKYSRHSSIKPACMPVFHLGGEVEKRLVAVVLVLVRVAHGDMKGSWWQRVRSRCDSIRSGKAETDSRGVVLVV